MSFLELKLKSEYHSGRDDLVKDFFIPVLNQSILYKRAAGFFSSSALVVLEEGILRLIKNGGTIQMISSPKLNIEDWQAVKYGCSRRKNPESPNFSIGDIKNIPSNFEKARLNFLSNLIALNKMDFKIAFLEDGNSYSMFHEKLGLMYDSEGNIIAFSGSMNETENAFLNNYESIDVFTSWSEDSKRVTAKEKYFDSMWNDCEKGLKILNVGIITDNLLNDLMKAQSTFDTNQDENFNPLEVAGTKLESLDKILPRVFDKIRRAVDNSGGLTGVSTRFIDLDRLTGGLQKSDLIILAARPSMGKTALALNIAMNAALENNIVAIFSLEMRKEQIAHRLLSAYGGINSQKLSTGKFDTEDFKELLETILYLTVSRLFIDDTAGLSLTELQKRAKKLKQEQKINLIVVDYVQLMQGSRELRGNRVQEISEISRGLKALALELDIPILALSQLSRGVESRADKRPLLSDLRESGSLEQDADIVAFLYREDYYDKETENANIAELIIAKNRSGPTATINLQFDKECMRFGSFGSLEER